MKLKQYIFFSISLIFIVSCLDEITIDNGITIENHIAIVATLKKGTPTKMEVFVSRLSSLNGRNQPLSIADAEITLIDENEKMVDLDNLGSGYYEFDFSNNNNVDFVVETNTQYRLQIKLGDNEYLSDWETLLPVPKISSLSVTSFDSLIVTPSGNRLEKLINLNVTTPILNPNTTTKSNLLWEFAGTFKQSDVPEEHCSGFQPPIKTCFLNTKVDLDRIAIFNGESITVDILNQFPIFQAKRGYRFAEGYNMLVKQMSITKDAYTYLYNTNQLLERKGGILENPVGKVKSNFTNIQQPEEEVFGYFYATEIDTLRLYISPADANFPTKLCPTPCVPNDPFCPVYDQECCNCLLATGSTLTQPEWW